MATETFQPEQALIRETIVEPSADTFADRVRRARSEQGMSQQQVCAALQDVGVDMTRAVYGITERGEREPRLSEAIGLQQVLGVDLDPQPDDDSYAVHMSVHEPDGTVYGVHALSVPPGLLQESMSSAHAMAMARYGGPR